MFLSKRMHHVSPGSPLLFSKCEHESVICLHSQLLNCLKLVLKTAHHIEERIHFCVDRQRYERYGDFANDQPSCVSGILCIATSLSKAALRAMSTSTAFSCITNMSELVSNR